MCASGWSDRNARRAGRIPEVNFHGGGEPALAWDALTGAVDYARRISSSVLFATATNGVMSRDKAEYVAKTFRMVTVSLDGPPDIQDAQRPRADGLGSFDEVMAFLEVLRQHQTPFAIRATITAANVEGLAELVEFMVHRTSCRQLHFEPAFLNGRCCRLKAGVPTPDRFGTEFIKAMDRARALGVGLRFSPARLMGAFSSFCGCAQDAFNITPEGDVTACFEVSNRRDPLAETFYFGRFNRDENRFVVDRERLARLRSMTVHNKPMCTRCFAKWSCAGDCPVKGIQSNSDGNEETPRCRMIQAITRSMLEKVVKVKS